MLISISHFPATGRPQAGLSFAPFVYEYYITEGATRFLAVFYGQFPAVEMPTQGGCVIRAGPFVQTGDVVGNFVWLDGNRNGIQDPSEEGIAGLCVNLYDHDGNLVQRTATDSNGFYGFNVEPGTYSVEFVRPADLVFTSIHAGDIERDSDADPTSGRAAVTVSADDLSVDAGLVRADNTSTQALSTPALPAAQVGPIRSGRLIYRYLAQSFQNSCLIFASASSEILPLLPKCLIVFHELAGGGFMLDVSEMEAVARKNKRDKGIAFDYSGYVFSPTPPPGGQPATDLHVFIAYQNQSAWLYDPLLQSYYRYVDTSEIEQAGVLHPDSDRLTARQLHFENVVVLYAKHEVVSPTNLDIHLDPGKSGKALLFRDGQVFNIRWTTAPWKGDRPTKVHTVQFLDLDEKSIPLKPGHTWVIVVTPETTVEKQTPGHWLLSFFQPEGAK